jgi:hypothetical protein
MESLDHKAARTTKAMIDRLGLHQSSVSHALKELMEEDLGHKKGQELQSQQSRIHPEEHHCVDGKKPEMPQESQRLLFKP